MTSNLLHRGKTSLDAFLSFFYPEVCQVCGGRTARPHEGYVCAECRTGAAWIKAPFCEKCGMVFAGEITGAFTCSNCLGREFEFEYARAAVLAKGVALTVIHLYKYQQATWVEPWLAELLTTVAGPALQAEPWDMIVPVPLHRLKQSEREFNQAERLAWHLARATGIPLNTTLLKRVKATETQTRLKREARTANVQQAFAPGSGDLDLRGQRIVLVDDVLTTGATTDACARVLKAAGAESVIVWTLARAM
jgi:ComF family protein